MVGKTRTIISAGKKHNDFSALACQDRKRTSLAASAQNAAKVQVSAGFMGFMLDG